MTHSLVPPLSRDAILAWLLENDAAQLELLWAAADGVRREHVGDDVKMRGLVELSNICRRQCLYCGIRAGNKALTRYRLTTEEVQTAARHAAEFGYGTVVLQAGEDAAVSREWMTELIRWIKAETSVAVTLSLGERSDAEWAAWRAAGADRYLLRFETSDTKLFHAIHPQRAGVTANAVNHRLAMLERLRNLGYEIGSGVMAGIPCQRWESLTNDIALFGELKLDMIGCGPFLPHPDTPLGNIFAIDAVTGLYAPSWEAARVTEAQREFCRHNQLRVPTPEEQVVPSATLAFKVIALARLVCPGANIPSTTAIATLDAREGRRLGLSRGANVIMPNVTPTAYRAHYAIYPNKAARLETPQETDAIAKAHLAALGRPPAKAD